jgi:transposase
LTQECELVLGQRIDELQTHLGVFCEEEALGGYEALWHIFEALDLEFVERVLSVSYGRRSKVGRPNRNLVGMFKVELVKRLIRIESYEELYRLLQMDNALRNLCVIKEWEKPYHPSTLSRFRRRIGPEGFERLMKHLIRQLDGKNVISVETLVLDATFIKAHSQRDPQDSSRGLSDIDARLRKQGRNVTLGYGVHLATDASSEMPITAIVEPANVNEKKIAAPLLRKTVKQKKRRWKNMVADTQYSSAAFRDEAQKHGVEPVIPYPKNQMKGRHVLRIDRKFRSHGPARLKRLYRRRSAVERATSRLKDHFGLRQLRTRGLSNVLIHTLLCLIAMLMTALSSILLGHEDLMRSPVSLMKLIGKL